MADPRSDARPRPGQRVSLDEVLQHPQVLRVGHEPQAQLGAPLGLIVASALFALLVLGVVSVIWSYAAPPVLGFFGIKL